MKRNCLNNSSPTKSANGLTQLEVLVLIAIIALLAAVLIPAFAKARPRAARINCISNLKQIGLAFRLWSNDHGEKFPWNISTINGGTLEFADRPEAFRHYLAASNELTSPKVLACQNDKRRTRISSWDQLTSDSRHVSYFLGLDAEETKPQSILSGDRNLTTNGIPAVGLVKITLSTTLGWTRELHGGLGNVGLGDGSAHQWSSAATLNQFHGFLTNTGAGSIRLVIP